MYYRIDSTRVSHNEYWQGTKNPLVLVGWLTKWLRIPLPSSTDDPPVESLASFEVAADQFPPEVQERFKPLADDLIAQGFKDPIYHSIHDRTSQTQIYWITFAHSSGRAWARLHRRIWLAAAKPRLNLFPVFLTAFQDGRFLVTSGGRFDLSPAPECRGIFRPKMPVATLWAEHQREMEKEQLRASVKPVTTPEQLRQAIEAHHAVTRDYHLKRGVFAPMSPEQEQRNTAPPPLIGGEHTDVLAELEALQNKKPSWGNALVVLVVSAALFLGAGSAQWSWKLALAMIPILLFHELGHFLTMRLFNYRNLQMFFIPFFGAAVTGQHYNVPGWKKALVSLMGPVPGIALGIAIGIAGLFLHEPLIMKAALLTLILNGFNLLPVLPLDGGWVLHATLFCRHPLLDGGFRVLAALGLFGLGIATKSKITMYLAIPMLISLPVSYRTAKLAAELRRKALPPIPDDTQTVPPETASTIIGEVKRAFPTQKNNKTLAQLSLNVFELLNARPPHWAATLGLLFLHGASLALAVVFGLVFVLGRDGNLREGLATAAMLNNERLMPFDSAVTHSGAAFAPGSPQATLVATLKKPREAVDAYTTLSARVPANASLTRFGQTLLLSLPVSDTAARKQWFSEFERLNTNAFVCSTNFSASLSVACMAPDEARGERLRREAEACFGVAQSLRLIPPWITEDSRTPTERAAHAKARESFQKLQLNLSAIFTNSIYEDINRRMNKARKQGDEAAVKDLQEQSRKAQSEAEARVFAQARTNSMHVAAVIDYLEQEHAQNARFYAIKKPTPDQIKAHQQERATLQKALAPHLGTIPETESGPATKSAREAAAFGYVSGTKLVVMLNSVSLASPPETAQAIVAWLQRQGCQELRYSLHYAGPYRGSLDEED